MNIMVLNLPAKPGLTLVEMMNALRAGDLKFYIFMVKTQFFLT